MKIKKVQVGWDYDEPYFPWYANAHQVHVNRGLARPEDPPPTEWDPTTYYGCTLQEWYDVLNDEVKKGADGMYAWDPDPKAVEGIQRLYKAGHGIHFITARGQFGDYGGDIQRLTKRQLMVTNTPYDSLHFVEDKVDTCLRLGLDYMIDDRLEHYYALSDAGINCYLLTRPWNEGAETKTYDPYLGVYVDKRLSSPSEYVRMIIDRHGWRTGLSVEQRAHVMGEMVD